MLKPSTLIEALALSKNISFYCDLFILFRFRLRNRLESAGASVNRNNRTVILGGSSIKSQAGEEEGRAQRKGLGYS